MEAKIKMLSRRGFCLNKSCLRAGGYAHNIFLICPFLHYEPYPSFDFASNHILWKVENLVNSFFFLFLSVLRRKEFIFMVISTLFLVTKMILMLNKKKIN